MVHYEASHLDLRCLHEYLVLVYGILRVNCCYILSKTAGESFKGNGYIFMGGNSVKTNGVPSEMGSALKGKNLLPIGSKFFPFRVDLTSEGFGVQEGKQETIKVASLIKKWRQTYQMYQVNILF